MSRRGLFESLITEALRERLHRLDADLLPARPVHRAEIADRLALHVARVLERAIDSLPDDARVERATDLARRLVDLAVEACQAGDLATERPVAPARLLTAILERRPDGRPDPLPTPLMPLLDTALLTNAPGEPRVGHQVVQEIPSADRIDVVMAFIRRTGIQPLLDALRRHCEAGRPLRVLTTTYTGSTEEAALQALYDLGAQIRVSYDTSTTRLHAKAWLFHRDSGFSTAFIGSSNLTHSAQITGLEWNVRVSGVRNPAVVDKVAAVFESYWQGGDFLPFDRAQFVAQTASSARSAPVAFLSPIELRPDPFQERLLEQIALSRAMGHHRNLLVSATGTGKTVMAALDYQRLRESLPRARLLFVAHRKEILEQSLSTYRQAVRDHAFGELWVDGARPTRFEHVFASIQSLNASGVDLIDPDEFDVVVIDEIHHAAAASYRTLLERLAPVELLGLTATPERSDEQSILGWFGGRIAAELRLWDAIDQHRLVPFQYYGVHDGLDYRGVTWRRGRGYELPELSNLYTADDLWARRVLQQVHRLVDDPGRMRALGFCVGVEHARFMARVFNQAGVPSVAIWGDSPAIEREDALRALAARKVNVVFSVDLFNEGVDVPAVDTLLMLRPTDSPTLFLQQLGRGLRRHPFKTACTVLDFVGQHRREFRFDRRLGALLGGTRAGLMRQVEQGFPFLPAGCHFQLDPVASDIVLRSLREALPGSRTQRAAELRAFAAGRDTVSLREFLAETGLALTDVYAGQNDGWSALREAAGLSVLSAGPLESELRRAVGRLLHVDDPGRIDAWTRLLSHAEPVPTAALPVLDRRYLRMLIASVVGGAIVGDCSVEDAAAQLWQHPQVRAELLELLPLLAARIEHLCRPLSTHPDVPLQVHGRYTRVEILAAFGIGEGARVGAWMTGVRWAEQERSDLLAFTLDKTGSSFSPTTRYRDYAINRDLIHWESQSVTREDSPTGRRYRSHHQAGSSIMLFARVSTDDRAFHFLGPARYVSHQGETPMAITWRLMHPLPGDLFTAFAAAVA